jgi:hypothetical protein
VHVCCPQSLDLDESLEDAARAKHQLDAERWRAELRPRAVRAFAARATTLSWSRALLKAAIEELYPDALFTEVVGHLDRVPRRRWPQVLAVAVALRHSWRRDGLARFASQLRISPKTSSPINSSRRSRPSRLRFSGSPRPRQGASLRSARARRGCGLDRALGRALNQQPRDGRGDLRTVSERRA